MPDPYRPAGAAVTLDVRDDFFRLLVQSIKDYAIFLLDPTGVVASWNEGAQRIKGYKAEEVVGRHFSIFYPREVLDRGGPDFELVEAQAAGKFEEEGWRVRKDGTLFWANVIITPLYGEDKKLRGFAKVTRDLTERKAAEEALRHSDESYRLIVEGARDYAIFMLDPEGTIVTWNAGAERLKGYSAAEIIGQHFSKFYPREAIDNVWPQKELEMARQEGRFEHEGWRIRKDDSRFWANVVITALWDPAGGFRGFSKITRDLTERRRGEEAVQKLNQTLRRQVEELAEANRKLAQKSQENESFVYSVSHDVRTPLVNLQGFSQELRLACDELNGLLNNSDVPEAIRKSAVEILDGGMAESVRYMQASVLHLSGIVDALLRLSRAGRVVYHLAPVDVTGLVKRVVETLHASIVGLGAGVVIHELPPAQGDQTALEQVFSNLITNALRYADPSRTLAIEIGSVPDPAGRAVVYYVKDNGLGIPAEAIPDLFRAFQRRHPGVSPGEGIGLAMVRQVVERHHGYVRVESVNGQGSTFFIGLPAAGDRASQRDAE